MADCTDKNCPVHGAISVRGNEFRGIITSAKAHKTVTITRQMIQYVQKYERYKKTRSKIHAHLPECMKFAENDLVRVGETRKLSKTKSFVIVQNMGKMFGFEQREAALEESKHKDKEAEEKEAGEDK